ncbi:MAG: hypothetical protein P1V97_10075 [Planctomycetota bacterium]|nr:hypothetical protein [Planctomycetota bacterium]
MNNETDPREDPFEKLNITEMRAMAALDPGKLLRWITDSGSAFILGVEQFADDPDRWGGLFRLTINRNLELHFIPDFNTAMLDETELPQFCIMPHPLKAHTTVERQMPSLDEEDEEKLDAVTFYTSVDDFRIFCDELTEIVREWHANPSDKECTMSFPFLPESYFREFDVLEWLSETVLVHPSILKTRQFDGRLGYPVVPPQSNEELLEDIPPPFIPDDEEEEVDWESLEKKEEVKDEDFERQEEEWLEEQRRQQGY